MASLSSCQGCSPAEGLDRSQGESSHRASRMRDVAVWYMATWNVRLVAPGTSPLWSQEKVEVCGAQGPEGH